MSKQIQDPLVHLNGTSGESLLEGYRSAGLAVGKAMDVMNKEAAPNHRDYYPLGDDAWKAAHREHSDRYDRLKSVLFELQQLAESVDEQMERRKPRARCACVGCSKCGGGGDACQRPGHGGHECEECREAGRR